MPSMTKELSDKPPKPDPGMYVAVLLELAIVATFGAHHSWLGGLLCLLYFYFSATRAFLYDCFIRDEP